MGWWDDGDDIMGDDPANIIEMELSNLVEKRDENHQSHPTLQELVDAVESIWLVHFSGSHDHRVVAKIKSLPDISSNYQAATVVSDITSTLTEIYQKIEQAYLDHWQRKPKLTELMKSLTFVMSYQPEEYLSISEGTEIEAIVIE